MRTFRTKKEIQTAIREQITSNNASAIRAMLRIFQYQTSDEQRFGVTSHSNGVGFTSSDAEILTSFCKQLSYRSLSEKQLTFLRKTIGKYAGQLTEQAISNGLYKKLHGGWVIVNG